MSTTYAPAEGIHIGRPPCANCGAAYRLHVPLTPELERLARAQGYPCPTPYRPDTLGVAQRELATAEASGDQARIFTARGEVQRLSPRRIAAGSAATWEMGGPGPDRHTHEEGGVVIWSGPPSTCPHCAYPMQIG